MITSLGHTELTSTAGFRHAEPPKLISSLKGDLDWIVMKALEKDRARRYETANGLAMDIHRYLENEPVVARPPSQFYRLQKTWVKRNKIIFIAVAAVIATLLMGLGSSTWLFIKERQSLLEAKRGLASEVKLRQHAQTREKIAQATGLIAQNLLDQADQVVSGNLGPGNRLRWLDCVPPAGRACGHPGAMEKSRGTLQPALARRPGGNQGQRQPGLHTLRRCAR